MGAKIYRIAIVEDELGYQKKLIAYLNQYKTERKIEFELTTFRDGDGLVESFKTQFDIILMDIQMQFMDGMEAAREIRKLDSEVVILFITNMDQYATKGYEVDALDYLLKPVQYFIFAEKLDKAIIRMLNRKSTYILINVKSGVKKIDLNELCYVESQGHHMIFHMTHGNYLGNGTLKEFEEKLKENHFIRCNKGLLIHLKFVDGVVDGEADVAGEKLPISRTRKAIFMEALTNYISKVVK